MLSRYYVRILKRYFALKATKGLLMFQLCLSALLRTLAKAGLPLSSAAIIDRLTDQNFEGALLATAVFAANVIVYVSFRHYNHWAYKHNALYIHDELQRRLLKKATELDLGYSAEISHASIINTAYEDVTMCQRVPDYFFDAITQIFGMFISVAVLFFVDSKIGLITLGLLLLSLASFAFHTRRRDHFKDVQRGYQDEVSSLYSQIIDGHKEIHAFNLKADLESYLEGYLALWKRANLRQRFHRDFAASFVPYYVGVARIIIYFITAGLILSGEYSVAMLILVIGYFDDIRSNFDKVTDHIDQISRCSVAINRVYKILNFKTDHMLKFGQDNTDDISGLVEFKNVSFVYTDAGKKGPKFQNISFTAKPQSLTAIVGKSGSGKTTVFRLLLRFYKLTKGEILLDGKSIYDYSAEVYSNNVSIVTQKPFIFDMTIRENLDLVDKNHAHQIAACKTAGIHDTIMKLEKGYDTPLVADADNLSLGQKQLLSLARTLLSRSEVLLFDEVTSTLDPATTAKVVSVLKKLKNSHTVLMITHKPELMRLADNIIVIDKGEKVGEGIHKKLLSSCPEYKLLQK